MLVRFLYKDITRQEISTYLFGGAGRGRVRGLFAGYFPMKIYFFFRGSLDAPRDPRMTQNIQPT